MTRNPPLPQKLQKSTESTEKVCAHVANPCFRNKTLEDVIARKNCPLQWDTSAEMASFWPTLKHFKNEGLDASGCLSGRASGRASGCLNGRHVIVCPSILSWPEAVNGLTTLSCKIIINWPSKQTPICGWKVENSKTRFGRYVDLRQHTCNISTQKLQLHLHALASPVLFHVKANHKHKGVLQSCWTEPNRSGKGWKLWAVMGISCTVQCCRTAAFYIVKPALQSPIFKKKWKKLVGGSALQSWRLWATWQVFVYFSNKLDNHDSIIDTRMTPPQLSRRNITSKECMHHGSHLLVALGANLW